MNATQKLALRGPLLPTSPAGLRRSLTPDQGTVAEKLRGVEAERRKSRNLSADSLTTATSAPADVERLRTENKKYAEEIERIGADLAFVRNQVTLVSLAQPRLGRSVPCDQTFSSLHPSAVDCNSSIARSQSIFRSKRSATQP